MFYVEVPPYCVYNALLTCRGHAFLASAYVCIWLVFLYRVSIESYVYNCFLCMCHAAICTSNAFFILVGSVIYALVNV